MTNYITPNANYDLFSTASYATLDTYLLRFKSVSKRSHRTLIQEMLVEEPINQSLCSSSAYCKDE